MQIKIDRIFKEYLCIADNELYNHFEDIELEPCIFIT